MSTLKKELIEGAKEVFAAYPKVSVILATSDGTYFLVSAKSLARDHARKQSLGEPIEITREANELPVDLDHAPELAPEVEVTPETTPEVANHEKPVAGKKATPVKKATQK